MSNATSPPSAVARGNDITSFNPEPRNLAYRIAARVAARPNGLIRSFADDGAHRTETYARLWQRSADIAAMLRAAGAAPSCAVVILADNILDVVPAFWACLRGGFTAVTLTHAAKEFLFRNDPSFSDALASLGDHRILCDDAYAIEPRLHAICSAEIVPLSLARAGQDWTDQGAVHDPACLIATSGSTGRLKLVALSHHTLIHRYCGTTPDPVRASHGIGTFPPDGVTGHRAVYLANDAWTQLSPETITRNPSAILDAIETFGGSVAGLTNSMIVSILAADAREPRRWRLASLQSVGVGAEPIAVQPMQKFADLLSRCGASREVLLAGYGTTETGPLVLGSRAFVGATPQDATCLGPPAPGVTMRIVDDRGIIVAEGEIGELEVSCPDKIFSSYHGDADLTRDAFTCDGWWKTRDLGRIVDGQLYLHGRARDVLILGGKKLSLADIDGEMLQAMGPGDLAYGCVIADNGTETLGVVYTAYADNALNVEQAIKNALARRFGIQPGRFARVDADAFPRAIGGKIRRNLLGAFFAERPLSQIGGALVAERSALADIWNIALGREGPVADDADFFSQGGDSLRSLTLHLQISEAFSLHISSESFFAEPSFGNLWRLVQNPDRSSDVSAVDDDGPWLLPRMLKTQLLAAMETWPGERPTPGRTIITVNAHGTRPPLFWVFNDSGEYLELVEKLDPDQPLYAFRSGYAVSDYTEDQIQALALRYIADIEAVCPDGPFFIAGNCQGAIIALAMAQHAQRRKRHMPLLILMDWSFALQPYCGSVLLIAGRHNHRHNARSLYSEPEMAWRRAFASCEFVEIPGGYSEGFKTDAVNDLAACLTDRMQRSLLQPLPLMPLSGYQARVSVGNAVTTMEIGRAVSLDVVITNDSDVAWAATEQSGIVLSYRWLNPTSERVDVHAMRAALPALAPRSTVWIALEIMPPTISGDDTLNIDLCEEGNRWFSDATAGYCLAVTIVEASAIAQNEASGTI